MIGEPPPGIGNPNLGESKAQITEPGIVRNTTGRIIATGWPLIPHSSWKQSYHELGRNIAEEVGFELELKKRNNRGRVSGAYEERGVTFNLNNSTLGQALRQQLDSRMEGYMAATPLPQATPVEVCDIGGVRVLCLAWQFLIIRVGIQNTKEGVTFFILQ